MNDVTATNSADAPSRLAEVAAFGALLLVAVGGVFSLLSFAAEAADVPEDEDYKAVATLLDEQWTEGTDVVTALPAWTLRPFIFIRGKDRVSADALATAPLHRPSRLWVVAEPDSEAEVEALTQRFGAPKVALKRDRLRLLSFSVKGPSVVHDMRADLGAADVTLQTKAGEVACPPNALGVFKCAGRKRWQKVERAWALVSENSSDVIYAHPPPKGESLNIHWPAVNLGDALVVRGGFMRSGADKAKAPVKVKAEIVDTNGNLVSLGALTVPVAFDFLSKTFPVPKAWKGREAALRLRVSSKDNSSAAFAVDAYTIGGGSGPSDARPRREAP